MKSDLRRRAIGRGGRADWSRSPKPEKSSSAGPPEGVFGGSVSYPLVIITTMRQAVSLRARSCRAPQRQGADRNHQLQVALLALSSGQDRARPQGRQADSASARRGTRAAVAKGPMDARPAVAVRGQSSPSMHGREVLLGDRLGLGTAREVDRQCPAANQAQTWALSRVAGRPGGRLKAFRPAVSTAMSSYALWEPHPRVSREAPRPGCEWIRLAILLE